MWLSDSPGPNQADFFDALARRADVDLLVLYCTRRNAKWRGADSPADGHARRFLANLNPWPLRRESLHLNPGAWGAAAARRYDLFVVNGYRSLTALSTLWVQAVLDNPYVVWGEMIDRKPSRWSLLVKRLLVHRVYRRAAAVLTMGEKGVESHRAIGVRPERIHELPYTCDLGPYLAIPRRDHPAEGGVRRIVVTAQLVPRKQVGMAIRAFENLAAKHPDWELVLCGDGPQRALLEASVSEALRARVRFLGFTPKRDQPAVYASAHLFLLASEQDGWGMVIPEAMAAGLPVVTTTAVESAKVLLKDGSGGILVAPNDAAALTAALDTIMSDTRKRQTMGRQARQIAESYHAEAVAEVCANTLRSIHGSLHAEKGVKRG